MSPQAIGHTLTLVPLREQVVVLVLLLGCGLWASRAKTRLALVAVAVCAIFWLRANSHLEGLVLVSITPAHGLTLADLLVPLVAALVLSGQTERRRNERERRTDGRLGGRRSSDPQPVEADPDQIVEPDQKAGPNQIVEPDQIVEPGEGDRPADLPRPRPAGHDEPTHQRRGRRGRHRAD